jgi:hypothetical protein
MDFYYTEFSSLTRSYLSISDVASCWIFVDNRVAAISLTRSHPGGWYAKILDKISESSSSIDSPVNASFASGSVAMMLHKYPNSIIPLGLTDAPTQRFNRDIFNVSAI